MTVRIVTDTTAGLPSDILERYNIPNVAQYVHFGDEALREEYELDAATFYARQAAASELPKTSAPSVGDMLEAYRQVLNESPGATILSIHPSTDVSGTVRSARPAAAEFPDADIRIFDTRSVSIGLGLMVWEAARMAERGASPDAITARMEAMRDGTKIYFVVDTLEYLAKGGRIGRATHLVGSLLDIKPVLALCDGVVESYSRARTRRRSLSMLQEMAIQGAGGRPGLRLGLAHAVCADEVAPMVEAFRAQLEPEVFLYGDLGPSIGVHAGPGTVAVGWVHVEEDEA
jgi:DegV family protein with EDD domain